MNTPVPERPVQARANEAARQRSDAQLVLTYLADERGVDLGDYRVATIERGVQQRLDATGSHDATAYLARLGSDAGELDRMLAAVVVSHTGFFRDPDVFDALGSVVVPRLYAERPNLNSPLRAWSIGTATGEEAWSLAMVLAQACARADLGCFELLATDREPGVLAIAELGSYPAAEAANVPPELRRNHLVERDQRVVVTDTLRARVRFARHDVMGARLAPPEAVVASFDLIALRNVLIYFGRRLQEKVFDRLCAVLTPGAALVLGHIETLPASAVRAFAPFPGTSPDSRIYRYVG